MRLTGTYTRNEAALLNLLIRRKRRMTTTEIVTFHYGGRDAPTHARRSVVTVLNSLIKKVEDSGENFRISKTLRSGPHPNRYWVESRFGREAAE